MSAASSSRCSAARPPRGRSRDNTISSDGVSLTATVNVRFRLERDAIPVRILADLATTLSEPIVGNRRRVFR
jgi:hypothetical protein